MMRTTSTTATASQSSSNQIMKSVNRTSSSGRYRVATTYAWVWILLLCCDQAAPVASTTIRTTNLATARPRTREHATTAPFETTASTSTSTSSVLPNSNALLHGDNDNNQERRRLNTNTLGTPFYGGSAQSGAMFDIVSINTDLTITGIDIHTSSEIEEQVEVWTADHSHVNFETEPVYWYMVSCATIIGAGYYVPTTIPSDHIDYIRVYKNQRKAIFTTLVYPGGLIQYTGGPGFGTTGDVAVEDAYLKIFIGVGKTYNWIGTFPDRIWNGNLRYVLGLPEREESLIEVQCRPSMVPTTVPTVMPTYSKKPSSKPTALPSPSPSQVPTLKPSAAPSTQPSTKPSAEPSSKPSSKPTLQPSSIPTQKPSSQPSTMGTLQPSVSPTKLPSVVPTVTRSRFPTKHPTAKPSALPSTWPSRMPSTSPSKVPSATPSSQPSAIPSIEPSLLPSSIPTRRPSIYYVIKPSMVPSVVPSELPTEKPSGIPSSQPTTIPTSTPSLTPSVTPSITPSDVPTEATSGSSSVVAVGLVGAVAAAAGAAASAGAGSAAAAGGPVDAGGAGFDMQNREEQEFFASDEGGGEEDAGEEEVEVEAEEDDDKKKKGKNNRRNLNIAVAANAAANAGVVGAVLDAKMGKSGGGNGKNYNEDGTVMSEVTFEERLQNKFRMRLFGKGNDAGSDSDSGDELDDEYDEYDENMYSQHDSVNPYYYVNGMEDISLVTTPSVLLAPYPNNGMALALSEGGDVAPFDRRRSWLSQYNKPDTQIQRSNDKGSKRTISSVSPLSSGRTLLRNSARHIEQSDNIVKGEQHIIPSNDSGSRRTLSSVSPLSSGRTLLRNSARHIEQSDNILEGEQRIIPPHVPQPQKVHQDVHTALPDQVPPMIVELEDDISMISNEDFITTSSFSEMRSGMSQRISTQNKSDTHRRTANVRDALQSFGRRGRGRGSSRSVVSEQGNYRTTETPYMYSNTPVPMPVTGYSTYPEAYDDNASYYSHQSNNQAHRANQRGAIRQHFQSNSRATTRRTQGRNRNRQTGLSQMLSQVEQSYDMYDYDDMSSFGYSVNG